MKLDFQSLLIYFFALIAPFFLLGQWTVIDTSYLKVEYSYQYRPYEDDTITIDEPVVLLVGNEWLQYTNAKNHELDKVIHAPKKQNMNFSGMVGNTRDLPKAQTHSFSIYRKVASDTVYTRHSAFPYYKYTENSLDFNWKVTNAKKEISGHQCIKALGSFRGREYVAWFAPDVPVLAGPYKFGGLPGLIVAIEDIEQDHIFTLTGITKYEGPLIKSYTHKYKPYGKWVERYLKKYEVGINNGVVYVNEKLKQNLVPNTPEGKKTWLVQSSVLNPIELITSK